MKVFVEVGYYEIKVRPFRKGDVAKYYSGVGGLFTNHKNAFRSFESAMCYIEKKKFEDSVVVHRDFEKSLIDLYPYYFSNDTELKYSGDGNWILWK